MNSKKVGIDQSGQAVIEYVLLLIVILSLLFGVLYQFNIGFRSFATQLFEYYSCLINEGQLPGSSPRCTPPEFSFQPQESSKGQTTGGGGGGSSGGTSGGGGGTEPRQDKPSNTEPTPGGSGNTGADTTGGSRHNPQASESASSPANSQNRSESEKGRTATVPLSNADRDRLYGKGESGGRGNGGKNSKSEESGVITNQESSTQGRPRQVPLSAEEKLSRLEKLRVRTIPMNATDAKLLRKKIAEMEDKKRSLAQVDSPWTFGDWLRYLIIAAILIAIFVFFSGQIQSFRKGRSKD